MLRKLKRIFHENIKLEANDKTLNINGLYLTIDPSDSGAMAYESKGSYEELANPLYKEIKKTLNPSLVIDIGANYGFTGLVFAQNFSEAKIVLIEPDDRLCPYINHNFKQNGFSNIQLINAICGEKDSENKEFSLNPTCSQDNRVIGASNNWVRKTLTTVSLNKLIKSNSIEGSIFIKIDTQGYEEYIFRGGHKFLTNNKNWIIKTEFAPYWLISQGTKPVKFLSYLTSTYHVVEFPVRPTFLGNTIADLFKHKLMPYDTEEFINHIKSLNRDDRGWCDLLILPKNFQWFSKL